MRDQEELIRRVVEAILEQEARGKTEKKGGAPMGTAFLIGKRPPKDLGWHYVTEGEYQAVVIGSLSSWDLLTFPDPISAEALLRGKPVFLWAEALDYRLYRSTCNRGLYSRLLSAERRLKDLGVQTVGEREEKILTAQEVRRRLQKGEPIQGRLTPLARDVLEKEGMRL